MGKYSELNEYSSDNQSEYCPAKRSEDQWISIKKLQSIKAKQINSNISKWDYHEKDLYFKFIKGNRKFFLKKKKRNTSGVFFRMALFIKTRTYKQCRSHHQKALMKYGTVEIMLKQYQNNKALCKIQAFEQETSEKAEISSPTQIIEVSKDQNFNQFSIEQNQNLEVKQEQLREYSQQMNKQEDIFDVLDLNEQK